MSGDQARGIGGADSSLVNGARPLVDAATGRRARIVELALIVPPFIFLLIGLLLPK